MNRNKPNKIPYHNYLPVVDSDKEDLSEERMKDADNDLILSSTPNIPESEIMHNAKIRKFLSLVYVYGVSQAYQIEEGDALKRVSIIECNLDGEVIYIRHIEKVIDGLVYEEYLPETIREVKLINKYLCKL